MAGDSVKDVVGFPPACFMATPAIAFPEPLVAVQFRVVVVDVATLELPAPLDSSKYAFHLCVWVVVNELDAFLFAATLTTKSPTTDAIFRDILFVVVFDVDGVPVGVV